MQDKQKRQEVLEAKNDKMHDYVTHFSQIAELLENSTTQNESGHASSNMMGFAKGIKEKVELNRIKGLLKNALHPKTSTPGRPTHL